MLRSKIIKLIRSEIIDCLNFDYFVKISLCNGCGVDSVPCVSENQNVTQGQIIAKNSKDENLSVYVHSSINGKIKGVQVSKLMLSNMINNIQIEPVKVNDFKKLNQKKLNEVTIQSLKSRLLECGIIDSENAGYPIYDEIENFSLNCQILILNACIVDKIFCAECSVLYHYTDEIISGINILKKVCCFKKVYIVANALLKSVFSDIEPKLCKNGIQIVYVKNNCRKINDDLISKNCKKFDEIKIGKNRNYAVLKFQTVKEIYNAVEFGLPVTGKIISVCGNCLKGNYNVCVPIGVNILDVVKNVKMEICSVEDFEEKQKKVIEDFQNWQRKKFSYKENCDKQEFYEKQKVVNSEIFEFLKYEKKYKRFLRKTLIFCENDKVLKSDNFNFNVQKTTNGFEFSNRSFNFKKENKIKIK